MKHTHNIDTFGYLSNFLDKYQNDEARYDNVDSANVGPPLEQDCRAINPATFWDRAVTVYWQSDET